MRGTHFEEFFWKKTVQNLRTLFVRKLLPKKKNGHMLGDTSIQTAMGDSILKEKFGFNPIKSLIWPISQLYCCFGQLHLHI